jgi:hypothetical protein
MEPLLDDRVDLILSHGGGTLMNHWINTGVILVRATPWARSFFDDTATLLRRSDFRALHPGITQWRDQKAILMQLLEMPGVERIRHVKVLPREMRPSAKGEESTSTAHSRATRSTIV